jgi:hypothetical protein
MTNGASPATEESSANLTELPASSGASPDGQPRTEKKGCFTQPEVPPVAAMWHANRVERTPVADAHASAIYLSSAAGGADAIAVQRRACNEYAERNGLRSVAEFSDTGSGFTVRPGLRALLDGLDDPGREWGSVVAFRLDRFGRSHEVLAEVVGRCQAAGVGLLTAGDPGQSQGDREADVCGHLLALIPGQRPAQLFG